MQSNSATDIACPLHSFVHEGVDAWVRGNNTELDMMSSVDPYINIWGWTCQ